MNLRSICVIVSTEIEAVVGWWGNGLKHIKRLSRVIGMEKIISVNTFVTSH
jgi:hypothetical protein